MTDNPSVVPFSAANLTALMALWGMFVLLVLVFIIAFMPYSAWIILTTMITAPFYVVYKAYKSHS
jgi:hypothetical protein